jgi:hypothetical protein
MKTYTTKKGKTFYTSGHFTDRTNGREISEEHILLTLNKGRQVRYSDSIMNIEYKTGKTLIILGFLLKKDSIGHKLTTAIYRGELDNGVR